MLKLWLSGACALALGAGVALYLMPLQPGVLVLQLAYSPRTFGAVIHAWSADDLLRYRTHLPYDFLPLACYTSFGWLLAALRRVAGADFLRGVEAGAAAG